MRNTLKFELLINMRWEMLNNRTEFNLLEVVFVKHINGPTGSRIFVYYCFFIGFVLAAGLILLFNRTGYITVDMSFLLNLLLLVSLLFLIFRRRALGIFAVSVWAFHFVFLWLAPLIQTRLGSYPNTMYFDEKLVVQTNLLVFVFLSAFIIASLFGEREPIKRLISYHIENRISLRTFMVVFVLTLIILGLFFKKVFPYFHPNFGVLSTRNETQVYNLIVRKFLFNFPIFLTLWILTDGRKRIKSNLIYTIIVLVVISLLLVFKNPLIERRNALGPIYLSILLLFFRTILKNKVYLSVLLATALLVFSLVQPLTHLQNAFLAQRFASFAERARAIDLKDAFNQLDYDSWSMGMAGVEYVSTNGPTYGRQMIGSLLFFIPRSWWNAKPTGSGHLVAEKLLMARYSMWFSNLSFPLFAEGYINFGVLGVILFGWILGRASAKIDSYLTSRGEYGFADSVIIYIAFHMIFMLRGDLMSSFAYLIGFLLAVWFLPQTIQCVLLMFR